MKTRNLFIVALLIGAVAFTSCSKDNDIQPSNEVALKSDQTGGIWTVQEDPLGNSPDPFTDKTTIRYKLKKAGKVRLSISNGEMHSIVVLVNAYQKAGVYEYEFDGSNLPAGSYYALLNHDGKTIRDEMRKIVGTSIGNPLSD
jgi:hypothetical protein